MNREMGAGKYFAVLLFGIAFGFIEAAIVIYLRAVLNIGGESLFPVPGTLNGRAAWYLTVESQRELATLILLICFSLVAARSMIYRLLIFLLAFAVWDLVYYLVLYLYLGWPQSLLTYDILFLIPTIWIAPVLCPVLVSGGMVLFPSVLMYLARRRSLSNISVLHWMPLMAGMLLMLYSFMAEAEHYLAGGLPPRFPWWAFALGYGLSVLSAAHYTYSISRRNRLRYG